MEQLVSEASRNDEKGLGSMVEAVHYSKRAVSLVSRRVVGEGVVMGFLGRGAIMLGPALGAAMMPKVSHTYVCG